MNRIGKGLGLWVSLSLGVVSCGGESVQVEQTATSVPAPTAAKADGPISFRDETSARGIEFTHAANRTENRWIPEVMGAGIAIADFNRDGAPDLYLVGGGVAGQTTRDPAARDKLFMNDGRGQFSDVSEAWNVGGSDCGMGVACGDYDNDGWTDLLLTSLGSGERLLRNSGAGFKDVTVKAGLTGGDTWGASAGFFDADGDGDLDLYVVRYLAFDEDKATPCWKNGRPITCSPKLYDALPDTLWINQGDGTFQDGSAASGVSADPGKGLALALGDLDWDGDVDIYVANDSTRNQLYMNNGKAVFKDRATMSGVAYDETGAVAAGMGADFSDVDGNGTQDIVCSNFQDETTNIYLQRPLGVYRDQSYALGVGASARQRLSFGLDFFDVDNDGDEDLFVANGHVEDNIASVSNTITFAQQDSLYLLGEDHRFTHISDESGADLRRKDVTRAVATADFDGDGWLDLAVTTNDGPLRLLMNRSKAEPAGAVILWLEGIESNRSAIGARVETAKLRREVRGASSYLAHCDSRIHIGLAGEAKVGRMRVLWPSGLVQELEGLEAGTYHLLEGKAPVAFTPGAGVIAPH